MNQQQLDTLKRLESGPCMDFDLPANESELDDLEKAGKIERMEGMNKLLP